MRGRWGSQKLYRGERESWEVRNCIEERGRVGKEWVRKSVGAEWERERERDSEGGKVGGRERGG